MRRMVKKCGDNGNERKKNIPPAKETARQRSEVGTQMAGRLLAVGQHKHSDKPHTPPHTGTVQRLTLLPLTSSVSAQAIWPKNS